MTFWIITLAMTAVVSLLLIRALIRNDGGDVANAAAFDMQVYRDQLAEVERDVARGVVPAEDAGRIKTEISRRILAADTALQSGGAAGAGPKPVVVGLVALLVVGGSLALYFQIGQPGYGDLALADRIAFAEEMRKTRPGQQEALERMPPLPPSEDLSPRYLELMEKLRETVAQRPDDLQGQQLLAQNEASIGNFVGAAEAQRRVLQIKGADASASEITDYAELMVMSAGGYVSPEAENALSTALDLDPDDGRARYYVGLMMVQNGRPDVSFRIWNALLRRGPADAPWIEPIKGQIMEVAALAGETRYSLPAIGNGAAKGPSAEDIEAAGEMTAAERMEMIGGMVAGLSDRLATEGGPPEDWARLITSLGVLGQSEQALAIFNNAMEVFAGNPGALDMIRNAGSQAGVAE
ncbi:c-type cytochrome biogenesis protein CcmI [Sulfitobacter mediterraneus]|uniref:c-type cytochrome biogenesis protein CcmI n=1 Tax=Sulfitobacter mediterraneus TaxID=83219 RepID=UPI0021A4D079|nr:c-type cytochrome biogenesis protein CcmI [Sulfitobacter mediterraneus]UWR10116.1 c-type cytochrome biogenesis protein CcmI [Sulfitobacter mediterraneus]